MSGLAYRAAGVDIEAADEFIGRIQQMVRSTYTPDVVAHSSGYAGLLRIPTGDARQAPVIAATCDGVGTKLLVAHAMGAYEGIGRDLVAMNVNDLATVGARPLLFLDYLATGKLEPAPLEAIVRGVVGACRDVGCALLGGETAEMPDVYVTGDLDVAGFAVGIVESGVPPDVSTMRSGDVVLALRSSGLHANGFSLARKVLLDSAKLNLDAHLPELGRTLGSELLTPTALYVEQALGLMNVVNVKAAAHITGGGLLGRARAMLPDGLGLVMPEGGYHHPPIIDLIRHHGGLSWREMAATFNMGLGFLAVVAPEDAAAAEGRGWLRVGELVEGESQVDLGYPAG